MTTISATNYAPYSALGYGAGSAARSSAAATSSSSSSSTNSSSTGATTITLSEAAKAALASKDFATVTSEARTVLDALLAEAGLASPYKDGELAIDLTGLDRRAMFAVASNSEGRFTTEEQAAAAEELGRRFDAAMAGPAAVARVTGDITALYKAAGDYLESMAPEEKATGPWQDQKAAIDEALKQLVAAPDEMPAVANDPVADYLARADAGQTAGPRDFGDVATDVRTALDRQYADAEANGKELVFSKTRRTGQLVDFAKFDSRSLSAIALNEGGKFSQVEIFAASAEVRNRSGAALLAGFKSASGGTDPTAFAKNIISAFASMSPEERSAAGWSDSFYAAALQNYESSTKIAEMFAGAGTTGNTGVMSLLSYL